MKSILPCAMVTLLSIVSPIQADHHDWIPLFDGRTFMGWQSNSESPTSFSIEDGTIRIDGPRAHLFYVGVVEDAEFKNFEFRAKVKTMPMANSGIYFHTRYQEKGWPDHGYEAQVNTTHGDVKKTGGLYAVQDVDAERLQEANVQDGEWFD